MEKQVGLIINDYEIIEILPGQDIQMRCNVCGCIKKVNWYSFIKQSGKCGAACGEPYYNSLIGKQFGDFIILEYVPSKDGNRRVKVKCVVCGLEKVVIVTKVIQGKAVSHGECGSVVIEGLSKEDPCLQLFIKRWQAMRSRTTSKHDQFYHRYGGRGISSEYYKDFQLFYKDQWENFKEAYSIMECVSLERIDVDGNYEPNNITWIEWRDQNKNKTTNKWFEATSPEGIKYYARFQNQFAKEHNLSHPSINMCLHNVKAKYKDWIFRYLEPEEIKELKEKKLIE